ncbi:MAG TPA: amidohydrolase family protein, partial [Rheinheimera sp.]|uniref:amidohydrolase family protein n=1 Tax=Rheinheimera sp. TaxID=1869214 RepID=UPI002F94D6AD
SLESARLVGAAHYSGSITAGKNADLLVIDGDPTKNISDIRKVALVFKGAHYYKPQELYPVVGVKPFTASLTLN